MRDLSLYSDERSISVQVRDLSLYIDERSLSVQ